jgi:hypothetical protein
MIISIALTLFNIILYIIEDFPVLQTAILAELARDECKSPLFLVARELIPNNPIVFVRICALLLSEIYHIEIDDNGFFSGLNGSIAQDGLFLLLCGVVVTSHNLKLTFIMRLSHENLIIFF